MIKEVVNAQGERIDCTFHPGKQGGRPLAIIGHGVTGNKDRPFIVTLAEELSRAGVSALRISFSGNGASGGKFIDSTISKEVEDLGSVIDAVQDRDVIYIGHSMGGAVGVLRAARDRRIKGLVSLAGMVHTKAFAEREFGMVKPGEGFMWDDASCPLSQKFMDDMAGIGTVLEHAANIHVPWLLIHGTEDDVVPIQDSHDIFTRAHQPKQFVEIRGSNHVFAGEHALAMAGQVAGWIEQQFGATK